MSNPSSEPLLPVKNRLESFWLSRRDPELKDARTTPDLPTQADVVIVGSGLSGALTSYHMMKEARERGRELNVVMLEADETCGSSTARNGGHCKPVTFIGYQRWAEKHGKEVANSIFEFEEAALDHYVSIVTEEKIECDLHVTRAFDAFFDPVDAARSRADLHRRRTDFPEAVRKGDVRGVDDPVEMEKIAGVKGVKWGASYPAGHLWPYMLATSLIRIGLKNGMNLQTYTPALGLDRSSSNPDRWVVKTPRGDIDTETVIVTTNAYTSSFLPEFKEKIIPVRGTACAITPAESHSPAGVRGTIPYTYGFRHATGDTDYLIARQGGPITGRGDKSIILGGAKSAFLKDHKLWHNNRNDDEEMPGARKYFEGFMKKHFSDWNGNARGNVDLVWSGVLGYSSDFMPYVGQHPDRKGVFVCAGFTGHGMPQIPGSTKAMSSLAVGYLLDNHEILPSTQKAFEKGLPKPFRLTKERFDSEVNVIKEYMGQGGSAQGVIEQTDEAAMLVRAKL